MNSLRQPTIKARISDIVNGKFIRKEGLEPSYVLTDFGQKIARTRIVGTITDKFRSEDGNYSSITLNDDSGSIRAKAFGDNADIFDDFEIGDLVYVIGRVREYAEENYVIPEIVKKILNPNYETYHKLEVLNQLSERKRIFEIVKNEKDKFGTLEDLKTNISKKYKIDPEIVEDVIDVLIQEKEKKEKDYKPQVLQTIEKLDEGDGVEAKKLFEESKLPNHIFEEVIRELLADGICYEPKPGKIKKV